MAAEGDPSWDLVAAHRTLPRQSCSSQSTSSMCLWLTLTGLTVALPGHPRAMSDTGSLIRHDPYPHPPAYILSCFLGNFPVLNPSQFLSCHGCHRLINEEGSLVPVPAVQLQLQPSQAMVFQRAPSPQPQLLLTPKLFIKGRKKAFLVSSLSGNAGACLQHDKMQSKWWFNFDSNSWWRAETTWLYLFLSWKGSSPPLSHPGRDKNTHPPSPEPKVGGFCEGSPLKCPQNPHHFSPANKYHSAAVPWLRLHGKCCRLFSGGRNWGNPSGQGNEICCGTTAALADAHLESPTSDALGTKSTRSLHNSSSG